LPAIGDRGIRQTRSPAGGRARYRALVAVHMSIDRVRVGRAGGELIAAFVWVSSALMPHARAEGPNVANPQPAANPASSQAAVPAASPPSAVPTTKIDYADPKSWLCRPGRKDACSADLSSTVVRADGKLQRETWSAAPKPPIDCFYVYPTVSRDSTLNSDMTAGEEEKLTVQSQFARFGSVCRLYAPLYRQTTVQSIRAAIAGATLTAERALSYSDVRDAFAHYMAHDNRGRGVVLIGHSQGAKHLSQLLHDEIEGSPAQAQIVSALLIGSQVTVPRGKDVGGTFQQFPLCRAPSQIGCIISYSSFRASAPPPADSRFAKVDDPNLVSACTNPAALAGGSAPLHAYLRASGHDISLSTQVPGAWVATGPRVHTPFVTTPGLLSGECLTTPQGAYLSVAIHADPNDPRVDDIVGDVISKGQTRPEWGLHAVDMHLTLGDLVAIVRQQARTYQAARARGRA
jgi:hypothetical protein